MAEWVQSLLFKCGDLRLVPALVGTGGGDRRLSEACWPARKLQVPWGPCLKN